MTRRTKTALISGAVLAAGAAAVLTVVNLPQEPDALNTSIVELAPQDSTRVMVSPSGDQWWKSAASMMGAQTGLKELSLAEAPVQPIALGFIEHPSSESFDGSATRVLAVDAGGEENAEDFARWLDSKPGSDSRNGMVIGSIVAVTDISHVPGGTPEQKWAAPEKFLPTTGAGSMWIDIDGTMETGADQKRKDLSADVMPKLLGYQDGSTSVLTSKDGSSWAGEWTSGGLRAETLDFKGAEESLEKIAEVTEVTPLDPDGINGGLDLVEGGYADISTSLLVSNHEKQESFGGLDTQSLALGNAVPATGDVTAIIDQRALNSSMKGFDWASEASPYVSYGLGAKGLEVSYH